MLDASSDLRLPSSACCTLIAMGATRVPHCRVTNDSLAHRSHSRARAPISEFRRFSGQYSTFSMSGSHDDPSAPRHTIQSSDLFIDTCSTFTPTRQLLGSTLTVEQVHVTSNTAAGRTQPSQAASYVGAFARPSHSLLPASFLWTRLDCLNGAATPQLAYAFRRNRLPFATPQLRRSCSSTRTVRLQGASKPLQRA